MPDTITLSDLDRLRLENLWLRCDLLTQQVRLAEALLREARSQARQAINTLLCQYDHGDSVADEWRVDLDRGLLVRQAGGQADGFPVPEQEGA